MAKTVLSVDQSTQGTKALLFDETGKLLARADLPHRQIINEAGWAPWWRRSSAPTTRRRSSTSRCRTRR
jgi:sugar (pentulose or hexulose) kinase